MDQAGDGVFMLGLHRNYIPVGADGDNGLLQIFGLVGRDQLLQDVPDFRFCSPDVAAYRGQLGAGGIRNFVLPQDGTGDFFFQRPVSHQGLKQVGDGSLFVGLAVLAGGARRT